MTGPILQKLWQPQLPFLRLFPRIRLRLPAPALLHPLRHGLDEQVFVCSFGLVQTKYAHRIHSLALHSLMQPTAGI